MTTQHTKGPWVVQYQAGDKPYIVADQGKKWDNPVICDLYADVTPEDSVTTGSWLEANDNAEANARLIAAAPDLLEALKAMLEVHGVRQEHAIASVEIPQSWVELSDVARAAIAKATGAK